MSLSSTANEVMQCFRIIEKECDLRNVFCSNDARMGYFLRLSIGDKTLEADIPVRDPQEEKKINAIAVIERIRWDGLAHSPIEVSGRLSAKNKALLQEAFASANGRVELEAEWIIYEYDYDARKYYRSFHTDKKMIKLTITENSYVYISPEQDLMFKSPVIFSFEWSLTADNECRDQKLSFAYSSSGKVLSRPIGPG
jgi:hypothetical protein